eukprot:scaffold25270_cov104-Isochrysis_galbana.AAC.9
MAFQEWLDRSHDSTPLGRANEARTCASRHGGSPSPAAWACRARALAARVERGIFPLFPRSAGRIFAWPFRKISVEFSTKRKIAVQFCKISDESTAIWRFFRLKFGVRFV